MNKNKKLKINRNKNNSRFKINDSEILQIDPDTILNLDTHQESSSLNIIPVSLIEQEDQCLICLEPTQETNKLFRMKDVLLINSNCECNGKFHINCLTHWINVSKICPICRKQLTINLELLRHFNSTYYYSSLIVKFKQFTRKFVNIFYAILMIMTRYILFLFFISYLLKFAKEIYNFIIESRS
jgi:hypothetical protein